MSASVVYIRIRMLRLSHTSLSDSASARTSCLLYLAADCGTVTVLLFFYDHEELCYGLLLREDFDTTKCSLGKQLNGFSEVHLCTCTR